MTVAPNLRFLPESFRTSRKRRLGQASEFLKPVLTLAGAAMSKGRRTDPPAWRRGLILGHNHIGDVLYRTGSLPALASALPQCSWTYLTAPQSAPLLQNNPHVSEILPIQKGENAWSISRDDFAKLRSREFDVALCTNSLRYYPDLLLATSLGIPNRVSFVHKGMSGLVTHPMPIDYPAPYPEYFRSVVATITGLEPTWSVRPQIFPDRSALDEATGVRNSLDFAPAVVACVATTRQQRGNWPAQFLIDLLTEARKTSEFVVAFCGAPDDAEILNELSASYPNESAVVAGRLGLMGFAAFLERCNALVTLDSGPRHLGNAVSIPVIFARNMSHSQNEAGAYCETEIDVAPPGEFLTDEQIRRVAAETSPLEAAKSLSEILARESPAWSPLST